MVEKDITCCCLVLVDSTKKIGEMGTACGLIGLVVVS